MSDEPEDTRPRRAGAIGYGRPPKDHQFKKGQSGNPRGRPRKRRGPPDNAGPREIARHEALRIIRAQEDGRPVKITVLQAAVRRLAKTGLAGDRNALLAFVRMSLTLDSGPAGTGSGGAGAQVVTFAIPDNGRGDKKPDD